MPSPLDRQNGPTLNAKNNTSPRLKPYLSQQDHAVVASYPYLIVVVRAM